MRGRSVAGGLLVVIISGAAFLLWPGEAGRVRARVLAAADQVSTRPGEGDVDRLVRLAGFARGLAPDVVVEVEPGGPSVRGRDAVAALATQLSAAGGPQRIELTDLEITLDEASTHAVVTAVARIAPATPDGAPARGTVASFDGDAIRIELARTNEGWLITRASPAPALAR